ncbi:HAMP domain-containing sensor histidine kinase [Paraflavisolibacter sp. H34]|uniref:sensor histidine kinase n=1 Tax=Huijunlia imazamoxiresistens TaxID=3127457 RepID=UPI003016CEFB
MKLLEQYKRLAFMSGLSVLLLGALIYYFVLRTALLQQLDLALEVEKEEILDGVNKRHTLPAPSVYQDQRISFEAGSGLFPAYFISCQLTLPEEHRQELSRQLVFPVTLNGQVYNVTVSKSQEATEELVRLLVGITAGLACLMATVLYLVNRLVLKTLWKPFYSLLEALKNFDLNAPAPLAAVKTKIVEFRELHEGLRLMSEKVLSDYRALKEFTDHASHEMKNPLALINSKLDVFIQDPALSEGQLRQVQGIYTAVGSLSRMSNALLLLARIENRQFKTLQEVHLKALVQDKIDELDEWIRAKAVTVTLDLQEGSLSMDRELAAILVINLVSNAIRHSEKGAQVRIALSDRELTISNPGRQALDGQHLFDRFYRAQGSKGTGLGLAIAKQICDQYGYMLRYDFKERRHQFTLKF